MSELYLTYTTKLSSYVRLCLHMTQNDMEGSVNDLFSRTELINKVKADVKDMEQTRHSNPFVKKSFYFLTIGMTMSVLSFFMTNHCQYTWTIFWIALKFWSFRFRIMQKILLHGSGIFSALKSSTDIDCVTCKESDWEDGYVPQQSIKKLYSFQYLTLSTVYFVPPNKRVEIWFSGNYLDPVMIFIPFRIWLYKILKKCFLCTGSEHMNHEHITTI